MAQTRFPGGALGRAQGTVTMVVKAVSGSGLCRRVPPARLGTPQPARTEGRRASARHTLSCRHVQALQSRLGVLLLKQGAPPSPRLPQPAPGNTGSSSGVFLLLLNPFIKGMWLLLNEGEMPRKQPTCGWLAGADVHSGSRPTTWTARDDAPASFPHFPVVTITVLVEISQKITPLP